MYKVFIYTLLEHWITLIKHSYIQDKAEILICCQAINTPLFISGQFTQKKINKELGIRS